MKRYTLKEIKEMPVLHEGHFENVIIDNETEKVVISRMTVKDGEDYNNKVSHFAKLRNGNEVLTHWYEANKKTSM